MLVKLGWMALTGLLFPGFTASHPPVRSTPRGTSGPVASRVTLWTDRDDPYLRGEGARVYLSTDQPAYVTVLRVDTDGRLRVLFPREPWGDTFVRDHRTFEVTGSRGGRSFIVDDDPGLGYLFAVASPHPFDYDAIARGDYWDYRLIEGGRIRGDPYVTLTDLAERIVPDGEYDYDVVSYYVDRRYDYPRFVCYDCHAYASYDEWDPYGAACSRFRVVIYDDPRYYPYRYGRGRDVVIQRPSHPGPRYVFRDADPDREYVTRLNRRGDADRRREADRGRTSEDVGGPGTIPAPGLPSLGRGRPQREPELSPARPLIEQRRRTQRERVDSGTGAPDGLRPVEEGQDYPVPRRKVTPSRTPPQSTGEPELRRRRP